MKRLLKSHTPITFVLIGCLLFGFIPTAHDFASSSHHIFGGFWMNDLIKKVHEDHWDIGYTYGDDCDEDNRPAAKDLEAAITEALQVWLQPLRDMETKEPIVSEFRYELEPPDGAVHWLDFDLRLRFYCGAPQGRSSAGVFGKQGRRRDPPPSIRIDQGPDVNHPKFIYALIHELGHAMGMGDTYTRGENWGTKGGLSSTAGTQPAAAMATGVYQFAGQHLSQDDKNGMMWLYKVTYEDLDPVDCFFPDYEFEADPDGCVPKSPLLFEIKQGHVEFVHRILRDDKNIDVNTQDDTGATALHYALLGRHKHVVEELLSREDINVNLRDESRSTALHYAVLWGFPVVVDALLSHKDIWISPRNKAGKTPLDLARDLGVDRSVKLLSEHPNRHLSVAPKGKLATKWATLKQRD